MARRGAARRGAAGGVIGIKIYCRSRSGPFEQNRSAEIDATIPLDGQRSRERSVGRGRRGGGRGERVQRDSECIQTGRIACIAQTVADASTRRIVFHNICPQRTKGSGAIDVA